MPDHKTHLFKNNDELADLLYTNGLHSLPACCVVGTTNNTMIDGTLRGQLYETFLSILRMRGKTVWITGGTKAGIIQILSDAIKTVNGERDSVREHHIMLGFIPESKQHKPVADKISHLFIVKDAEERGEESPFIASAVAYIGSGKTRDGYVAGGGPVTRSDVFEMLKHDIAINLIKGSGRYADKAINENELGSNNVRVIDLSNEPKTA